jgi:hypothetical protein
MTRYAVHSGRLVPREVVHPEAGVDVTPESAVSATAFPSRSSWPALYLRSQTASDSSEKSHDFFSPQHKGLKQKRVTSTRRARFQHHHSVGRVICVPMHKGMCRVLHADCIFDWNRRTLPSQSVDVALYSHQNHIRLRDLTLLTACLISSPGRTQNLLHLRPTERDTTFWSRLANPIMSPSWWVRLVMAIMRWWTFASRSSWTRSKSTVPSHEGAEHLFRDPQ